MTARSISSPAQDETGSAQRFCFAAVAEEAHGDSARSRPRLKSGAGRGRVDVRPRARSRARGRLGSSLAPGLPYTVRIRRSSGCSSRVTAAGRVSVALLEAAIEWARDDGMRDTLSLTVFVHNTAAIALLSYVRCARRPSRQHFLSASGRALGSAEMGAPALTERSGEDRCCSAARFATSSAAAFPSRCPAPLAGRIRARVSRLRPMPREAFGSRRARDLRRPPLGSAPRYEHAVRAPPEVQLQPPA